MPPRPIHGATKFPLNKSMHCDEIFCPANSKTQLSFGMSIDHAGKCMNALNHPIGIRSRCQKIRIESFTELNCLVSRLKKTLIFLNRQSVENGHHRDKEGRSQQIISSRS